MNTALRKLDTETGSVEMVDMNAGLNWQYENTNVIVDAAGKVFVNSTVCKVLGLRTVYAPVSITWGRERFYSLTNILDDVVEHATFPRRSDRERAVAARNLKLIEVLMGMEA